MKHLHSSDCQAILDNLNSYIDGELDEILCGEIESHIEACPNCQIVVNTLKKTIHLYQVERDKSTLPPEVQKRLYASLELDDYVDPENE